MPAEFDWGVDDSGNLLFQNDDLTYVASDPTHIEDTIVANPLWWKQFPADGVGIRNYTGSVGKEQQAMGEMKKQLIADGYNCNNPTVIIEPSGKVTYNPKAERL